ncbi:MAG: hypothetical protein P1V19_12405, partial [Gimesia sp.]|nr:hypothetical protein [Gimesia sp.]
GELRAIEKQIGQKVPRSKDQPKLEPKDRRPAPESRTRKEKEKTGRRSGSKVFTQRTTRRSKRTVAGEDKPKQQGQKNTKWRRLKKPAKQTS